MKQEISHCPYCETKAISISTDGNVSCNSCYRNSYQWQHNILVNDYLNLKKEDTHDYINTLFLINTNIRLGKYNKAFAFAKEAIILSSRTPQGWEYKALTLFYKTELNSIIGNNGAEIKAHLTIAQELQKDSPTYDNVVKTIAYTLFNNIKQQINSITDLIDFKSILEQQIYYQKIRNYISAWEICYEIYPNTDFLKELVSYFSGLRGFSWFDIKVLDVELETISIIDNSFKAGGLMTYLRPIEQIIKETDPKYKLPNMKGGSLNALPIPLQELKAKRIEEAKNKALNLLSEPQQSEENYSEEEGDSSKKYSEEIEEEHYNTSFEEDNYTEENYSEEEDYSSKKYSEEIEEEHYNTSFNEEKYIEGIPILVKTTPPISENNPDFETERVQIPVPSNKKSWKKTKLIVFANVIALSIVIIIHWNNKNNRDFPQKTWILSDNNNSEPAMVPALFDEIPEEIPEIEKDIKEEEKEVQVAEKKVKEKILKPVEEEKEKSSPKKALINEEQPTTSPTAQPIEKVVEKIEVIEEKPIKSQKTSTVAPFGFQMNKATYSEVSQKLKANGVTISNDSYNRWSDGHMFRAKGSFLKIPGSRYVYFVFDKNEKLTYLEIYLSSSNFRGKKDYQAIFPNLEKQYPLIKGGIYQSKSTFKLDRVKVTLSYRYLIYETDYFANLTNSGRYKNKTEERAENKVDNDAKY